MCARFPQQPPCGGWMARSFPRFVLLGLIGALGICGSWPVFAAERSPAERSPAEQFFVEQVAPLLQRRCVQCHQRGDAAGGLSMTSATEFAEGGERGAVIDAGRPAESLLLQQVSGPEPAMPQEGEPLSVAEVDILRRWVELGASWPSDVELTTRPAADLNWWSLQPLQRPVVPELSAADAAWVRTPVDAFIRAKLRTVGLEPSPPADRRTLVRRLYFDLLGLPPTFAEVEAFVADPDPLAYEKLVDRLLESQHYGERWARHWLDVVHYGDSHGYDKDKLRPNAWPYRDYVIRSFNADKPYARFVQEQIAGDVLWPGTRDGIEATGFIAAGPWDLIGHEEVPESKLDGRVARHLDRDDMVTSTMNTFASMTVQCARCHDHKFDPVTQTDYYRLQAVFAALDRADREYDPDGDVGRRRAELWASRAEWTKRLEDLDRQRADRGGDALRQLNDRWTQLKNLSDGKHPEAFGYHSAIAVRADEVKWVQVDLGSPQRISHIILRGCHDDFAGIGAGFGFPVRFRVEGSLQADFSSSCVLLADETTADFANPGCEPVRLNVGTAEPLRYVRVTAVKLAPRSGDYIFALAELEVHNAEQQQVAHQVPVQSFDSIEAPVRWQRTNLVDGLYVGVGEPAKREEELRQVAQQREQLWAQLESADEIARRAECQEQLARIAGELEALPPPARVYCGKVHTGSGAFQGTGAAGGKPREIHVLRRGNLLTPGEPVGPGTVPIITGEPGEFDLSEVAQEGARRAALAEWLTRADNPLTWRSIVNRVWQYHFGRGLVDSPNDFGRMGQLPTHPELLDWLAVEFRDGGQSLKTLHRLMVTSSVYRQQAELPSGAVSPSALLDPSNQYLSRMSRRLLDAEAIRDTVLLVSGQLDEQLYGPPFQDFVLERPEHSPHYEYHLHDPRDPQTHRRSVYRCLVRSQQQPFMQTLDCADPSESVAKRNNTLTALQALTLLNNRLMVVMAEYLAERAQAAAPTLAEQIRFVHREALGREPDEVAMGELTGLAQRHGLPYVCRVVFNLNEFVFVD